MSYLLINMKNVLALMKDLLDTLADVPDQVGQKNTLKKSQK